MEVCYSAKQKPWRPTYFRLFEIIINVLDIHLNRLPMLWVYSHYNLIRHQNLSLDG